MNSKQWVWIYQTVKEFFREYQGRVPDDVIAKKAMELNGQIMETTKKTREKSKEANEQITGVMHMILATLHCLMLEEAQL